MAVLLLNIRFKRFRKEFYVTKKNSTLHCCCSRKISLYKQWHWIWLCFKDLWLISFVSVVYNNSVWMDSKKCFAIFFLFFFFFWQPISLTFHFKCVLFSNLNVFFLRILVSRCVWHGIVDWRNRVSDCVYGRFESVRGP